MTSPPPGRPIVRASLVQTIGCWGVLKLNHGGQPFFVLCTLLPDPPPAVALVDLPAISAMALPRARLFSSHFARFDSHRILTAVPSSARFQLSNIPVRSFCSTMPFTQLKDVSNKTTFTLNNGVKIPGLGFGTFANEGAKGESYNAVIAALKVGYRHLDCAWFYKNEEEVGQAVRDFLNENPSVKREDIFITTKVWNHLHEPDEVKWSFENSLKNFGLDYVDLFLVHWPIAAEKNEDYMPKIGPDGKYILKKDLTENPEPTWRAMEEIYNSGKAKAIGVSNWTIPGLQQLFKIAKVKPTVNQVEIHPFLPNEALVKFCQKNDVLPAAYSPLGSQDQVPTTGEKVRTNKTLNEVADRSGHTLAQVLLAWGLRRGYVVLPKSSTPSRIESNFQVPNLSDEDFEAVNKVAEGRHTRFVNMKDTFGYNVWPEESREAGTSIA